MSNPVQLTRHGQSGHSARQLVEVDRRGERESVGSRLRQRHKRHRRRQNFSAPVNQTNLE